MQYFAKKARVAVAGRAYDFSTILDLHLVIENQFYEEVCQHLEQEFGVPDTKTLKAKVSEDSA